MPQEEVYVYTKPLGTKKSPKKLEVLIFLIIIVVSAYILFLSNKLNIKGNQNSTSGNETANNQTPINETIIISIPSDYKGSEGLDYVRTNYSSELEKAKSLCTDSFKGDWIDTLDGMGCYNMQGFSTSYCNENIIQSLVSLCNKINGSPDCSTDKVICSI